MLHKEKRLAGILYFSGFCTRIAMKIAFDDSCNHRVSGRKQSDLKASTSANYNRNCHSKLVQSTSKKNVPAKKKKKTAIVLSDDEDNDVIFVGKVKVPISTPDVIFVGKKKGPISTPDVIFVGKENKPDLEGKLHYFSVQRTGDQLVR